MSLIVCCSFSGSPGVTTTALGLALTWPRDVILADCDRDPAQAIEAGYLRGVDLGGRGLAPLARAHRERRSLADELPSQLVPLLQHPARSCRYLPGFAHPAAPTVFAPVWPEFAAALAAVAATGTDVLVDAGRTGREGLPGALLNEADLVLVVVRSNLRSLAAARLHLPALREHLGGLAGPADIGIAVVGPGMPYSEAEIGGHFTLPVMATITQHPHAAVLTDGEPEPRRFADAPLMRSFRAAAASLSTGLMRREAVLETGTASDWAIVAHTAGASR